MGKMLIAAKWYKNKMGWSVIPCNTDKIPTVKWREYCTRLPTDEELETWFGEDNGIGIGIVCGAISNLTVIDIDVYKPQGQAMLELIQETVGKVFNTPVAITKRKGMHIYLRYKPDLDKFSRRLPHCDIQGEGHYVVAPPTEGYTWELKPST